MRNKIINWVTIVFSVIFIGFILMTLTYLINGKSLDENLRKSYTQMSLQKEYEQVDSLPTSTLDNFTDSLMILTATYQDENGSLKDAMRNPRITAKGKSPYGTLTGSLEGEHISTTTYARYWHGYLIFLRPLLSVFSYSQIRVINAMVQGALLVLLIIKLYRKKLVFCIVPFLSAYILINPLTIASSLQYSTVWYLVLSSMLCYLTFQDKIIEKELHYLFFTVIGMLTSFFDLLTYPIATLGMVLILMLVSENLDWKEAIKRVLVCGGAWTAGYGIMWASKWILASIILNENVIANANEAIQSRSSNILSNGREFSRIDALKSVANRFKSSVTTWAIVINLFLPTIIFLIYRVKNRNLINNKLEIKKNKKVKTEKNKLILINIVMNNLLVLSTALIPIVWYFVLANHSYIHNFFSFRTAVVFWFAIFMVISKVMKDLKDYKNVRIKDVTK